MIKIAEDFTSYTGSVRIREFKNGQLSSAYNIKNQGTDEFFNFLRDCVAGKSDIFNRVPFLLKVSGLSGTVPAVQFSDTKLSDKKIIYTFLISGINYSGFTFNKLELCSASGIKYAETTIGAEVTISENSNVYIEWALVFDNLPTTTNTSQGGN